MLTLKDLVGVHMLSGVDYYWSHRCNEKQFRDNDRRVGNDVVFRLDHLTYVITEDMTDFMNRFMTGLEITGRSIENEFPPIRVKCEHFTCDESDTDILCDILKIFTIGGDLLLEVGTTGLESHPSPVYNYYPENVDNDNKDADDEIDTQETKTIKDIRASLLEHGLYAKGDIVTNFKYNTITVIEQERNIYKYMIRDFATYTETDEPLVIYQSLSLYDDFKTYATPLSKFMSEFERVTT